MDTSANNVASRDRSLLGDLLLSGGGMVALAAVLSLVFSESDTSSAADPEDHNSIGHMSRSANEVRRRVDGTLIWNDLDTGDSIHQRDAVYVAADSEAVVSFDDGSRIEIDENSLVVVRRPGEYGEAEIATVTVDVLRGSVSGKARKRRMAIRTGSALMSLERNSKARVRLRKDRTTQIDVADGRAVVKTKNRGTVAVSAGQRQGIDERGRAGATQQLAIALASPEAGQRIFFTQEAPKVGFRWKRCRGVGPYLFELSRDPDFEDIIVSRKTRKPAIVQKGLEAGVCYWRVRRRSKTDPMVSEERKLTLVADKPPIPYQPRAGEVVYLTEGTALSFAWSEVPGVGRYAIEIARGQRVAVRKQVDQPSYLHRQPLLEEGQHCFRVRSDEPERGKSPWSSSTCFRVITRPLPRAPRLYKPKVEDVPLEEDAEKPSKGSWLWRLVGGVAHAGEARASAMVLRWEAVPGMTAYIIEIAEDRAFEKVVVRERIPHNYYRWRKLTHRKYFWRAKSIDAVGRAGNFSEPMIVGAVVAAPKPLEPKPGAAIGYGTEAPRVVLRWEGSELLAGYTVEIAKDPAFSTDAATHQVRGEPHFAFRPSKPGQFYWRVTGVDLNGQRSEPGQARRFVVIPNAPDPIRPSKQTTIPWEVEDLKIRLGWSKRPVEKYEIELARNRRFQKKVRKLTSSKAWVAVRPRTMGTLYWRVRCREPKSAWSRTKTFKIVPAVPKPVSPGEGAATRFRGHKTSVELRWQAVPKAAAYIVEVAASGGVEGERQAPLTVEGTSARLENLAAGRYTWKVRAVHRSGIESATSPERTFELIQYGPPPPQVEVSLPEPPKPLPAALHIGPRVAFFYNLGEVTTVRFGMEIGYRFPFWERRLGVTLCAGYYTATASLSLSGSRTAADSRLHAIPIELVGFYAFPTSIADLYLGGGLNLVVVHAVVSMPTHPKLGGTDIEFGFVTAAGAERILGPGAVFLEVRYALTSKSDGLVEVDPGGVTFGAGYRIRIL